jgi:hypothetical protein
MARKYIMPQDEDAAMRYATKAPFVRGETTYWHNSLNGFLAGVRYARKQQREPFDVVEVLAVINREMAEGKRFAEYEEKKRKIHRADTDYEKSIPYCVGTKYPHYKTTRIDTEITCKLCLKFKRVRYKNSRSD